MTRPVTRHFNERAAANLDRLRIRNLERRIPANGFASAFVWGVDGTPLSVAPTTLSRVPWAHFQTTDTSIFGTDTTNGAGEGPYNNAAGDTYIYLNAPGAYLASGSCVFESGAFAQGMIIDNPGGQYVLDDGGAAVSPSYVLPFEEITDNTPPSLIEAQYGLFSHRMFYVDPDAAPGIITMAVEQGAGAAKNLPNATLGIFYLGQDGTLAELY